MKKVSTYKNQSKTQLTEFLAQASMSGKLKFFHFNKQIYQKCLKQVEIVEGQKWITLIPIDDALKNEVPFPGISSLLATAKFLSYFDRKANVCRLL